MSRLIQLLRQFQLPVGATSAELRKAYFRQTWTCWRRGVFHISGNVVRCHVMWWWSWSWERKGRNRRKNQQLRHWRCWWSSIFWPSILRFDFADGFWQILAANGSYWTGRQKSYIQIVILAPMDKLPRWAFALLNFPLFWCLGLDHQLCDLLWCPKNSVTSRHFDWGVCFTLGHQIWNVSAWHDWFSKCAPFKSILSCRYPAFAGVCPVACWLWRSFETHGAEEFLSAPKKLKFCWQSCTRNHSEYDATWHTWQQKFM